jgi:hypothetical protein
MVLIVFINYIKKIKKRLKGHTPAPHISHTDPRSPPLFLKPTSPQRSTQTLHIPDDHHLWVPGEDHPQSRARLRKRLDRDVCLFGRLGRQILRAFMEPYEVKTRDDLKGWEEGVQPMPLDVLSHVTNKHCLSLVIDMSNSGLQGS